MSLRQRYDTLLIYDPGHSSATVNVWLSRPTPTEELASGKLVVLSVIGQNTRSNLDVINLIQEELRISYYQQSDAKPERAFELALHQTNQRLHQIINDGVGQWVDQANILVAAIWRDQVILSTVGTVHALLLRHSRIHYIAEPTENNKPNPLRFFSQIIVGQLQADDQLLFCSGSLLDYFSLEKLRRTLNDGTPSSAIHQWETTLLGVDQRTSFAAVTVQSLASESFVAPASRPVAQATINQAAPQVSMDALNAREQATEKLLSPSIWPAIRDIGLQLGRSINQAVRRFILRKPPRRMVSMGATPIVSPPPSSRPLNNVTTKVIWQIRRIAYALWSVFKTKPIDIQSAKSTMTISPHLNRRPRWSLAGTVNWFKSLSQIRQLLFAVSIILIFFLAISLGGGFPAGNKSPRINPTDQITDLIAKAEAALLYGGEDTAQQNATAAQELITKLPNRSSADKQDRQKLVDSLNALQEKLAHRTVLSDPNVFVQLTGIATDRPQQLYLLRDRLVTFAPSNSSIIEISLANQKASLITASLPDTGQPTTGTASSNTAVLFITDRNNFVEYDFNQNAWKPIDAALPKNSSRIQSIAQYQGRVYALDQTQNNIVRFSRSANSLGTGSYWMKEPTTLASARTLVVNGSIYVLQPAGTVEKYINGRKDSFRLSPINPPLTDVTRLWADPNGLGTGHLYLLEPSSRRLVVFDQTGKLLDQYQSADWTELSDMVINEKTKTAYVLNGTTVYSITLIH